MSYKTEQTQAAQGNITAVSVWNENILCILKDFMNLIDLFMAFFLLHVEFIYMPLMSQHRMLLNKMKWIVSLKSIMLLSKDFRSAYSK